MDTFPVYLPSNASTLIYPENTASDYHTRLDQPIRLEGEWEVGLQSINYVSKIDDSNEKSIIWLQYQIPKLVNEEDEFFHFRLTPDKKWNGNNDVYPIKFESDATKIDKVIETLNNLNDVILKDGEVKRLGKLFEFYRYGKSIGYRSALNTFTLELTGIMSECLGYSYKNSLLGKGPLISFDSQLGPKRPLTRNDYRVRFFNPSHLRHLKRLIFKHSHEKLPKTNVASIRKLWNERIEKQGNISMKYTKGNKMILSNKDPKTMVSFSHSFQTSFNHWRPLIGKSTRWATYVTPMNIDFPEGSIFLDIYSDELEISPTLKTGDLYLELFPWNYVTNNTLVTYLNTTVVKRLKSELKDHYDKEKHLFHLNITNDFQIKFLIGLQLTAYFGKKLSHLLGLQNEFLPTLYDHRLQQYYNDNKSDISILGYRSMVNVQKRQRQLFILCSIIKPTAYGVNHLPILRDFVHENVNDLSINEIRFDPIIYLPLKSNFIDTIDIQLTDSDYHPVKMNDSKTIITLFFRKVKEDNKTVTIH